LVHVLYPNHASVMCGIEPVENISLKPNRSQVDSVMFKLLFDMQKA